MQVGFETTTQYIIQEKKNKMEEKTEINEQIVTQHGGEPAAAGGDRCTRCLLNPCVVERYRVGLHRHITDAIIVDNASNVEIYERLCDVLFQHTRWYRRDEAFEQQPSSLPMCCKEGAREIIKQTIAKNLDYSSDGTKSSEEGAGKDSGEE